MIVPDLSKGRQIPDKAELADQGGRETVRVTFHSHLGCREPECPGKVVGCQDPNRYLGLRGIQIYSDWDQLLSDFPWPT